MWPMNGLDGLTLKINLIIAIKDVYRDTDMVYCWCQDTDNFLKHYNILDSKSTIFVKISIFKLKSV